MFLHQKIVCVDLAVLNDLHCPSAIDLLDVDRRAIVVSIHRRYLPWSNDQRPSPFRLRSIILLASTIMAIIYSPKTNENRSPGGNPYLKATDGR